MPDPKKYLDDDGLLYYDTLLQGRLDEKADSSDIPKTVAELSDSSDYAKKTDLPTTVAELSDSSDYAKKTDVPTTVAELSDSSDYALKTDVPTTVAELSDSSDYALKTDIVGGVRWKASVNSYSNLPASGMAVGDMYNIATADQAHGIEAGDNVVWNGSQWDVLRGTIDLSGYYNSTNFLPLTNQEIDALLAGV